MSSAPAHHDANPGDRVKPPSRVSSDFRLKPSTSQTYDVEGLHSSESMRSQGNTSSGSAYLSCAFPSRYRLSIAVVDRLNPSASATFSPLVRFSFMDARTCGASTLPSSTPHWSNELRPQMKPCVATRCS